MVHLLANQRVKWFTDNQGVVSIVSKGSMKSDLQSFAMAIYKICMINSVVLDIEWIPRYENEKADFLSRILDYDD
jgi:hypothetical protein